MMRVRNIVRWAGVVGLVAAGGCKSLDVQNPNNPDAARAFADPGAVAGLLTGAFKNWIINKNEYNSSLLLDHMADSYTSSWNNFNIRYYSSDAADCPPARCGWDNSPSSAFRFQIEYFWYGYYAALSNANDVLTAIRTNHVTITDAATTKMMETGAVMMQAMVFAQIALNYDQGFIVDETTDLSNPLALPLTPRAGMRDAAIAKFEEGITLAKANTFNSPTVWMGVKSGPSYTNNQLAGIMRTMQAELLAFYPRTPAENAQVNWGQVATYASQGLSAPGGAEFSFYSDAGGVYYDGVKGWGNDITTVRVDTRVAHLVTDGPNPAKVHKDPWPDPQGNPQPNAFDKRVGDGSWGPTDDFLGVGTVVDDGAGGTDYAFASLAIFRAARGNYHQSNLGHIRYSALAAPGYGLPGQDGTGVFPIYSKAFNDLLWAEGLARSNGDLGLAADLINKTRVTRGGLTAASAADGQAGLIAMIQYEDEIEMMGLHASPYYNQRRKDGGLHANTPRQMPIPAKELQVLAKELYTFGGPGKPDAAPAAAGGVGRIRNVREIWSELVTQSQVEAARRKRH
ncbi:MAG: hypothetical protein ABI647_16710 [Gemmatimonadota bacterium]